MKKYARAILVLANVPFAFTSGSKQKLKRKARFILEN